MLLLQTLNVNQFFFSEPIQLLSVNILHRNHVGCLLNKNFILPFCTQLCFFLFVKYYMDILIHF